MQMPSLVKYFAFVGAALLALLSLANFLLEPSTGATPVAAKPAAAVVKHEPGASRIERWRSEQAALKAAEQQQTAENASLAAKSAAEPRPSQVAAVQPAAAPVQPATTAAQAAIAPAPAATVASATDTASLRGEPTDEDRAADAARLKAEKAKAAKAKRAKVARERARAEQAAARASDPFYPSHQRAASNQQDQYYYYQRARQQEQRQGYAYAPRQSWGPFGSW